MTPGRRLGVATAIVCALAASAVQAQTVDDILARNLAARGGQTALDAVESLRQTSTLVMPGAEGTVVVYAKRPNLIRQELTLAGETMVEAYDGSVAWTKSRVRGLVTPTPVSGNEAETLRNQGAFDGILAGARARGDQIDLLGQETVGGRPAFHLRLTTDRFRIQHCYIDAETYLEVRLTYETTAGRFEQEFSDYREVLGIRIPFAVTTAIDGRPQGRLVVSNVELNVPLDVAMFALPPAAVTAPASDAAAGRSHVR